MNKIVYNNPRMESFLIQLLQGAAYGGLWDNRCCEIRDTIKENRVPKDRYCLTPLFEADYLSSSTLCMRIEAECQHHP